MERPEASLISHRDCEQFLWSDVANTKAQKRVLDTVSVFNSSAKTLEAESLQHFVDAVGALYTRGVQTVLKDTSHRKPSKANPKYASQVKLAVETYILNILHARIFDALAVSYAKRDMEFNRKTRSLCHLTEADLGLVGVWQLDGALAILANLPDKPTPLEKLVCLKKAVGMLMKRSAESGCGVVSADELVPLVALLVIRAEVPNWHANLFFINNFAFSTVSPEGLAYLLVSFEAGIALVESDQLATPWRAQLATPDQPAPTTAHIFFDAVAAGDRAVVLNLLTRRTCHPLCACTDCVNRRAGRVTDHGSVTVYTRDAEGRTALHISARTGNADLLLELLEQGGIADATDVGGRTPLHHACEGDMVDCVIILAQRHADVNVRDIDGNTPLHVCARNGHERCAQALLFQASRTLQVAAEGCAAGGVNDLVLS